MEVDQAQPTVLDLPAGELMAVLQHLSTEDKKHLSLSCKGFCSLVRAQWRTLLCTMPLAYDDFTPMPPPGLAHFTGLETIVLASDAEGAGRALEKEEWENYIESFDDGSTVPLQSTPAWRRWNRRLGQLLRGAGFGGRPSQRRGRHRALRLVLATSEHKSATWADVLCEDLTYPDGHGQRLLDRTFNRLNVDLGIASNEAVVGAAAEELGSDGETGLDREALRRMDLVARVMRVARSVVLGAEAEEAPAEGEAYEPVVSAVSAGWCVLDGGLPKQITSATMPWCQHFALHNCRVDQYESLEALRICFNVCEVSPMETVAAFEEQVLPQLTQAALPALRELHLGRPLRSDDALRLPLHRLDLSALTHLALNPRVALGAFSQLTHLGALHTLRVALPEFEEEVVAHPQDIAALSSLDSLRSVTVNGWTVTELQDVAALQQLTALHLERWEGQARHVKPARPMPALREATLERRPIGQDMRYIEDSKFARWALRRAAARLPGCQVLQIGTLGSSPLEVHNLNELGQAVERVDDRVVPLLAAAPNLEYLQLNTVVNILSAEVDRQCERGTVQLTRTLYAPPTAASSEARSMLVEDGGGSSDAGDDVEEEGEGVSWEWERSVEWLTDQMTEVLVAEFHYARVKPQE